MVAVARLRCPLTHPRVDPHRAQRLLTRSISPGGVAMPQTRDVMPSATGGERSHSVVTAGAPSAPSGDYDADIVILALDRADETIAAIRSALSQTGVSRHVFIVDQGSRPANLALLAAEVAELPGRDPGRPRPQLRRRGRSQPWLCPRAWPRHLRPRQRCGIRRPRPPSRERSPRSTPTPRSPRSAAASCCTATARTTLSSWGYPPGLLDRSGDNFDAITFVGAGHAIRRTAWQACNGYDDALISAGRSWIFACAPSSRDGASATTATSSCATRSAPSSASPGSGNRWFHYVRNRLYIGRKWGSGWLAAAAPLRVLCAEGSTQRPAVTDTAGVPGGVRHGIRHRRRAPLPGCTRVPAGERRGAPRQLVYRRMPSGFAQAPGSGTCPRGTSFRQQQRKDRGTVDQVAPRHSPGLPHQAMQPFQPRMLHPLWRARLPAGDELQAGADAKPNAGRASRGADRRGQHFLTR